jgi:hypothetical protein
MMLWWTSGHDVPLETARERSQAHRGLDDQPAGVPHAVIWTRAGQVNQALLDFIDCRG